MPLLTKVIQEAFERGFPLLRTISPGAKDLIQRIRVPEHLFENNQAARNIYKMVTSSYQEELLGHVPYNKLLYDASKVGIKEGAKPSKIVFRALEKTATPEEIASLTPQQRAFIPQFQQAYADLANLVKLPVARRVRDYATHLIVAERPTGIDLAPIAQFLPKHLQARFLLPRAKQPLPYLEDISKAFGVYKNVILRKHYREPYLDDILKEFRKLYADRSMQNRAKSFINDWLGRRPEGGPFNAMTYAFRRRFYGATLYANLSASLTNLSQILTALYPEVGGKYINQAITAMLKPEGRALFKLSGHPLGYADIGLLDIFQKVERTNQHIAFLSGYLKNLAERGIKYKPGAKIDNIARKAGLDMAAKTQFFDALINSPEVIRRYPLTTMFMGFPIRMAELIGSWAKKGEWNKLGKFVAISTLLGGPYAWTDIPVLKQLVNKSPELNDFLQEWEANFSLAGLTGVNLAAKFGAGVPIPGKPFILEPARLAGKAAWKLFNLKTPTSGDIEVYKRRYGIAPEHGLIGMFPWMLAKGGLQTQKVMKGLGNLVRGYSLTSYGQPAHPTDFAKEFRRVALGQPLDEALFWRMQERVRDFDESAVEAKREVLKLYGTGMAKMAREYHQSWNRRHPEARIMVRPEDIKKARRRWRSYAPQRARQLARKNLRPMYLGSTRQERLMLQKYSDAIDRLVPD